LIDVSSPRLWRSATSAWPAFARRRTIAVARLCGPALEDPAVGELGGHLRVVRVEVLRDPAADDLGDAPERFALPAVEAAAVVAPAGERRGRHRLVGSSGRLAEPAGDVVERRPDLVELGDRLAELGRAVLEAELVEAWMSRRSALTRSTTVAAAAVRSEASDSARASGSGGDRRRR
jgi:hypothetical protein